MKNLNLTLLLLFLTFISCGDDDDIINDDVSSEQVRYKNLQAYYPFEKTPFDQSGYNNHGIANEVSITSDQLALENFAYYFNGDDSGIEVPNNPQLFLDDEFTISAWIYPEEKKSQTILRKGNAISGTGAWPYGLSSSANELIFSTNSEGQLKQVKKNGYEINTWYLITGVVKDQKMFLYVNNELIASEEIQGSILNNDQPLLIGTRLNLPSSTFKGKIDEVRIYNVALNQSEITSLFNKK